MLARKEYILHQSCWTVNNDNVQCLWLRGTNKVSITYGTHTYILETNVLTLWMECREWIRLSHWQTQRQSDSSDCGGRRRKSLPPSDFYPILTVMGLNPTKNTWLNQGMVNDSINFSIWSPRGRGPSWSSNQNLKKRESSPPHLPLVGGRVKGSLLVRV